MAEIVGPAAYQGRSRPVAKTPGLHGKTGADEGRDQADGNGESERAVERIDQSQSRNIGGTDKGPEPLILRSE